jgi:hypothetical protein
VGRKLVRWNSSPQKALPPTGFLVPEGSSTLLDCPISCMFVLDPQDHMHLIPVSVESVQLGKNVPMELQYGAAN